MPSENRASDLRYRLSDVSAPAPTFRSWMNLSTRRQQFFDRCRPGAQWLFQYPGREQSARTSLPTLSAEYFFADEVVDPEGVQLARRIDSIQIDVKQICARAAILVYQREGRTGDVFFGCSLEGGGDSLDERGLPCSQVTAQKDELRWSEQTRQRPPEGGGLLCGMSNDFSRCADGHRQQYNERERRRAMARAKS